MIIQARPRRGEVIDTPRVFRMAKGHDPPETLPGNFIGEVKEGRIFVVESALE
jgi:5'-deoxynucleotidase YfbR-like HD superfamily hydrolase